MSTPYCAVQDCIPGTIHYKTFAFGSLYRYAANKQRPFPHSHLLLWEFGIYVCMDRSFSMENWVVLFLYSTNTQTIGFLRSSTEGALYSLAQRPLRFPVNRTAHPLLPRTHSIYSSPEFSTHLGEGSTIDCLFNVRMIKHYSAPVILRKRPSWTIGVRHPGPCCYCDGWIGRFDVGNYFGGVSSINFNHSAVLANSMEDPWSW